MFCTKLIHGAVARWDSSRFAALAGGVLVLSLMTGCAGLRAPHKTASVAQDPPAPIAAHEPETSDVPSQDAQQPGDWQEYRRLAALTMVERNPDSTYMGKVPQPLLGIPILMIDLHADGSIADITVERYPKPANARETTRLAIEAVRRAAPFASVAHLPPPWRFREVFLFDGNRRFKPQVLDNVMD